MARITQLQRQFFSRMLSELSITVSAQTPLGQMEQVFFESQVGSAPNVETLRNLWLRKVIVDNEGIPQSRYESDLVRQAVSYYGTPARQQQENWRRLYQAYTLPE